jgi:hypothetical protein
MRKSENPMLRRTSKSKHRKAKYKVQGSNPSQGRPEWLRSTRTTTMANKCDCTSFLPSQLFASPQQTPFHSLVKTKIQNLNFWFLSKMRVLHVLYEMSRICGCDVHDAIVCWKSFQLLCGSFDLDKSWRNYFRLKFWVVSPHCFLWLMQFHLHFTVQTAVETSSLLNFQLNVISSIVKASY